MAKLTRTEWGKIFDRCFICGCRGNDTMGLQTHELARGPDRAKALKEPAAWMRVCLLHHEQIPDLITCLAYKRHFDPEHFNAETVSLLRGRQSGAITKEEIDAAAEKIEFWDEAHLPTFS